MFPRRLLFMAVLLGTAVLPYLVSTNSGLRSLVGKVVPPPKVEQSPEELSGAKPSGPRPMTPGDVPVHRLEDVFRFDVTTHWVLGNWPRVSAALAELDTQGYRVPLITGTHDSDVAGSLTYYFNKHQQVDRITFQGTTGDTRRLVGLLQSRFGLQREITEDPRLYLYQVKDGRDVQSELRIRPAKIIRNDAPHSRFEVALNMRRPPE